MKDIILLDGGMGRELARRGAPFRQPEWSALALTEAPEAIVQTHLDFIRAGSQVITTNSYAIVPFHIGERFTHEAEDLANTAGRLARQAVTEGGAGTRVAASLPPLFGSYRPDLFDAARAPALAAPLLRGLAPHVDIWLAETQSSIAEAAFWKSQTPLDGKPFWASFTLEDTQPHDVPVLRSGEAVSEAVKAMMELGASAILFNCSMPEIMASAITAAYLQLGNGRERIRLGVYANAFEASHGEMRAANDGLDEIRKDTTPDNYLTWAQQWISAGASMVGGCCGIGPEHIARLAASLMPNKSS